MNNICFPRAVRGSGSISLHSCCVVIISAIFSVVFFLVFLVAFSSAKAQETSAKPSPSEQLLERGLAKTDNGDFQGAILDFDNAIRLSFANALAYRFRSYARLQVQDYTGTINDCSEVLRINPRDSNAAIAYLYRALAKFALRQYAGTTQDCSSALDLDPYADDALSLRGQARRELQDYEGAMNDFSDAVRMNHANASYYFMRGQVRAQKRDFIGAIGDFTVTLQLEPQALQAFLHRGKAKLSMNDPSACDDFRAALRLGFKEAAPYLREYCSP